MSKSNPRRDAIIAEMIEQLAPKQGVKYGAIPAKLEKEIPLPPDPRGRPHVYPWEEMQVGDSFVTSVYGVTPPKRLINKGYRFSRRAIGDGKARIWRVK